MVHTAPTSGETDWFVHDRFGMVIHWGIYAAAARHEWVKSNEQMTDEQYQKYFEQFYPDLYDPAEWARRAREAGMRYFVVTTKHHDGFCLWDSAQTDYKVTNTPWGKDVIAPMVEAFRAEGLRVGFYHSLIDWHHPEFPIDWIHPLRSHPEAQQMNQSRDVRKYADYLHAQVRELLTWFGRVDYMFFDFSYHEQGTRLGFTGKGPEQWQSEKLIAMCRQLQPGIVINDRTGIPQDVVTPEQYQPQGWVSVEGRPAVWETCQTFSGSWGYHRDETTWKSPRQLIQMLVNTVSCGGNLLMNVGPTARGTFDDRSRDALQVYADWMKLHGRAIYGCTMSELEPPRDCRYTQSGDRLYLHVYCWPFKHLHCPGLAGRVAYAQLLHDASDLPLTHGVENPERMGICPERARDMLVVQVPVNRPRVTVPVIELFLK